MVEPQLTLASWELEPEQRPEENGVPFYFRALWFGTPRDFLGQMRSVDGNLFRLWFRLADEPERGNFVCASRGLCTSDGTPKHPPYLPAWDLDNKPIPQKFVECVENELWGRLFVLNAQLQPGNGDNGCCTVFLTPSGWGRVVFVQQSIAEFQWSLPCALSLTKPDPMRHLEKVTALAQEPSHPLGFAFRWATLSRNERFHLALPLRNGDYEQWKRMIQLYMTAMVKPNEEWIHHHEVVLIHKEEGFDFSVSAFWKQKQGWAIRREENSILPKFLRWSLSYFRPRCNNQLYEAHPCVRSFVDRKPLLSSGFVEQGDTYHESLEALHQLREWLAHRATPGEIETLLRQH